MVIPLPNFIMQDDEILATTLSKSKAVLCLQRKAQQGDRRVFWQYCVIKSLFRMTKFHYLCLVLPKKPLLSRP